MSILKIVTNGISFIGKNHANIDKLSSVVKTKKFDAKSLGDAALFLPFGWQVKGLIWVGSRVYATYTQNTQENEPFENVTESNDSSIAMLNHFLTEAVATNVHCSKFETVGYEVHAEHSRDIELELWNQTSITKDFVKDFTETLFNRVYLDKKGVPVDLGVSQKKDLKLRVGSQGFYADLIVRANYEYVSEYEQILTLKLYVVENGEFRTGTVNLELDSADVEELIEVLETKKGTSTVIDSALAEAKETIKNVQNHLESGYSYIKDKAELASFIAIDKANDFSEYASEKHQKFLMKSVLLLIKQLIPYQVLLKKAKQKNQK